jgi:hypothetical protein
MRSGPDAAIETRLLNRASDKKTIQKENIMKRLFAIACASAAFAVTPASAMTEVECGSAWTVADANKDGTLSESAPEGARYFAALRVANSPAAEGKLSKANFLDHCKAGRFDRAAMVPGAPLAGANSFTESQVKDRLVAWGYATVAGLKKDSDGVWRGTATDAGKSMNVAVDFKGNIVAN